ncbi:MAG: helix-turn-helix domain-containing protein [Fusicatenibacter sp.]|nr:helix-turn-helix domain-containing protein [Fusicatenibacter sp.]
MLSLTRLDSHQLYIWHRTGAHLLETTTSSIPDISEESGFSSSRSFIEMFKKVNELTPKQYRDQCNEHKKVHHSND